MTKRKKRVMKKSEISDFANYESIEFSHTEWRRTNRAEVIQLIKTTLEKRGSGNSLDDPITLYEQFWSFEGELLFERPYSGATL